MKSIENKSTKEQLSKKTESKDQQNARLIQEVTQRAFKEFSIDEKRAIAILINKYLKLPKAIEPRELFQKLLEIKKNNLNNSKLAQIIINHIKKLNEKNTLDIKNRQSKVNHKSHQPKLDI